MVLRMEWWWCCDGDEGIVVARGDGEREEDVLNFYFIKFNYVELFFFFLNFNKFMRKFWVMWNNLYAVD